MRKLVQTWVCLDKECDGEVEARGFVCQDDPNECEYVEECEVNHYVPRSWRPVVSGWIAAEKVYDDAIVDRIHDALILKTKGE